MSHEDLVRIFSPYEGYFISDDCRCCAANFNLEVPNMHEAQQRVADDGARVLQETGAQAIYRGQASLKVQLPGHEVSDQLKLEEQSINLTSQK